MKTPSEFNGFEFPKPGDEAVTIRLCSYTDEEDVEDVTRWIEFTPRDRTETRSGIRIRSAKSSVAPEWTYNPPPGAQHYTTKEL